MEGEEEVAAAVVAKEEVLARPAVDALLRHILSGTIPMTLIVIASVHLWETNELD